MSEGRSASGTPCGVGASAPPPPPTVEISSRLDNIQNKSDRFWYEVSEYVLNARTRAKSNLDWMRRRCIINEDTGEILSDSNGETLSVEALSRSWYSSVGVRNNISSIVRRLKRVHHFQCDFVKFRPKFITLTFSDINESWQAERAIQKFLDALRHWAKRQGVKTIAYFWTSEIQARGALHYHILVLGAPFVGKKLLTSWWSYGFVDVRVVDDMGRAFKYLAKYLWKWVRIVRDCGNLASLPDSFFLFSVFCKRRYGFSKWFQLPAVERVPRWVRCELEEIGFLHLLRKASRAVGGGWRLEFVDDDVGETFGYVVRSPYTVLEWGT